MRTILFTLFLLVASAIGFSGCDKIESITQTDVSLEIKTVPATVDQAVSSFASIDSVDLSSNSTYKDNKTHIKKLKIDEILMTLTSHPGNAATMITSATANVSSLDGSGETNISTMGMTQLSAINGIETALVLTDAGKQKLADLLLASPNQARFSFVGNTDVGPVKFEVTFRLKMIITAGL